MRTGQRATSNINPSDRNSIFGPPNLLTEEDPAAYDALLTRVLNTISPRDIIEEIYVRDVAEFTWEIRRWRRVKKAFIASEMLWALEGTITSIFGRRRSALGRPPTSRAAKALVRKWADRDPKAIARVDRLLSSAFLTVGAVQAEVITAKSGHIQRMDQIISTAVKGRKIALREIGFHRGAPAQAPNDRRGEVASKARQAPNARDGGIAA